MNIDTPKTYNHPEMECSSSAARGPGCQDRDWSPRPAGSKLRQLHSRHFWEVTLNTVGPLYLMSITGNVEYLTQGNGKNVLWTHRGGDLNIQKTPSLLAPQEHAVDDER